MICKISGKNGEKLTFNCWGDKYKNLELEIGQIFMIKDVKINKYNNVIMMNLTRTATIKEEVDLKNNVEWNIIEQKADFKNQIVS